MTKTLYIVRHGNTFDAGDIVTRVGGLTDLPLSKSGEVQAAKLSEAFSKRGIDACYSSPLKRTRQTAEAICAGHGIEIRDAEFLREIDYGPDENRPETEVVARLGKQAITDWDTKSIVPRGWNVDPQSYINSWMTFIKSLDQGTTLVVTSNGVARFLLEALDIDISERKMKTGSASRLDYNQSRWSLRYWGKRPPL